MFKYICSTVFLLILGLFVGEKALGQDVLDGIYMKSPVKQYVGWPVFEYRSDSVLYDSLHAVKPYKARKLPKAIRHTLEELVFIPGGVRIDDHEDGGPLKPMYDDTTWLVNRTPRSISVSSFLASKKEVTNYEYRQFCRWVRDSIARTRMAAEFEEYYQPGTKKLDWTIPLDWAHPILAETMFYPEFNRFYNRRQHDNRSCIYRYTNEAGEVLQTLVYPDTLRWVQEFGFSVADPMTNLYNWHPAYGNYPVVGVSWEAAKAYCHWRSKQLRMQIKAAGMTESEFPAFRLPTEAEWEYMAGPPAMYGVPLVSVHHMFPWLSDLPYGSRAGNRVNFGMVHSERGLDLKNYAEDDAFYTSKAGSYPANIYGLYDLGGNAAEWTEDVPETEAFDALFGWIDYKDPKKPASAYQVEPSDDVESLVAKFMAVFEDNPENLGIPDSNSAEIMEEVYAYARILLHDAQVMAAVESPRTVKGGSWASPPAYLLTSSRQIYPQNQSSCTIGFREVLEIPVSWQPYFDPLKQQVTILKRLEKTKSKMAPKPSSKMQRKAQKQKKKEKRERMKARKLGENITFYRPFRGNVFKSTPDGLKQEE